MPELHPLLAARWSPRSFDERHELPEAALASLLEAARWAPSEHNRQPWRFVIGRRDDVVYKRIFLNLTDEDQRWAGRASALLATGRVDDASYDVGQAVAHLSLQAVALGLHTRQLLDFDANQLHAELGLPFDVRLQCVVAVGRLADPDTLPPELRQYELRLRTRQPLSRLVLSPSH